MLDRMRVRASVRSNGIFGTFAECDDEHSDDDSQENHSTDNRYDNDPNTSLFSATIRSRDGEETI